MEAKAAVAWATASRAHVNRDFRFNSQPLTAAFTERESMGGRAWPNVRFPDSRFDYAFTLWSNSTLGLLLYWWHSNRQHSGRGTTTIRNVESLPVLDLRALSEEQLRTSEAIFSELRDMDLKPAYLLVDDGWKLVEIEPESIEVNGNGTNGNGHHHAIGPTVELVLGNGRHTNGNGNGHAAIPVNENGVNGHHDEAAEPQQTLFYRPLWTHRAPSHISKTVLSTVHLGPPNWTRSRTFTLRFTLAL